MDIEEFYSSDERRRQSAEVELGTNWFDANGSRYELSWVRGHRGALRDAGTRPGGRLMDPLRGQRGRADPRWTGCWSWWSATSPRSIRWSRILAGWPERMAKPDGVSWVAERLRASGVPTAPPT